MCLTMYEYPSIILCICMDIHTYFKYYVSLSKKRYMTSNINITTIVVGQRRREMLHVIFVVGIFIIELCAPKYVSLLIIVANMLIPDSTPMIDEALGIVAAIKQISASDE